jgi:hypothetical protein
MVARREAKRPLASKRARKGESSNNSPSLGMIPPPTWTPPWAPSVRARFPAIEPSIAQKVSRLHCPALGVSPSRARSTISAVDKGPAAAAVDHGYQPMQQRQAAAGEQALARDMAKLTPGQRQNRRFACVGRCQRAVAPFAVERQPVPTTEQNAGNPEAGTGSEHRLGARSTGTPAPTWRRSAGPRWGSDSASALKSLSSSRRCSPSFALSLGAREGPAGIGQPDHLGVRPVRQGRSPPPADRRAAQLVEVGLDGFHRTRQSRRPRKSAAAAESRFRRAGRSGRACRRCRRRACAAAVHRQASHGDRQVDRRAPGRRGPRSAKVMVILQMKG